MSTALDLSPADVAAADTPFSIEHVDPSTLLVDINIRTTTELDRDFLVSVRDLGVLVPIVAVRTAEQTLCVRYGHRRTLAAISAGHATVPVAVVGDEGADDAERIITQWHENEHRSGLTTAGLSIFRLERRRRAYRVNGTSLCQAAGVREVPFSGQSRGVRSRFTRLEDRR